MYSFVQTGENNHLLVCEDVGKIIIEPNEKKKISLMLYSRKLVIIFVMLATEYCWTCNCAMMDVL